MSPSRIVELQNRILKAKQAYYYGGQPLMSDAEYDALEDELALLSPGDPVLSTVGAPVPADSILSKARHSIPMGSQSKVNSPAEFLTWYQKSAEGGAVHASLKGDGASAAAYYRDGRLHQAISRGDGVIGEDITANAARFKGLPLIVQDPEGRPFNGAVRFEVILTVEDWAAIDPEQSTNPRNMGSGIMGRKTGAQCDRLTAFCFSLDEETESGSRRFASEHERWLRIQELGFNPIPARLCVDADAASAYFEEITRTRDALPFWIDGMVFKIDDVERQLSLGSTANRPKGQIAWKFDSRGAQTTLVAYSISVGHTGALIPTAHLEPVEIGGTTVSNALLSNWDEIARLDVALGDSVWVIKANDIIPKIVGVRNRPADRRMIPEPTECPVCKSSVRRRRNTGGEAGAIIECAGDDCSAKSTGKLKRWINNLDIQGIGDSVRIALVEQFGVEDASGLYRLHEAKERLAELVINPEKELRLGQKRAATILADVERVRKLTLVQFLGSLGIERLGSRRVELLIQQANGALDTLEAWQSGQLRDAGFAARVGVPGVGSAIADSIDAQRQVIQNLLDAGVEITGTGVEAIPEGKASGTKTVCISGKLPSGKKKGDYAEPLAQAGYRLIDTVSKDLDLLVVADPEATTGKAEKARRYGVRLIGEAELIELIGLQA